MIVSLGYDRFRVVTATWGFFPLCGFCLFCVFVRSLLYLVWATSRELPVSYIEHLHRYHHIHEPPPTCFSPCFAPVTHPTPVIIGLWASCHQSVAIKASVISPSASEQAKQHLETSCQSYTNDDYKQHSEEKAVASYWPKDSRKRKQSKMGKGKRAAIPGPIAPQKGLS